MIRLSFPKSPPKTKARIEKEVRAKFGSLDRDISEQSHYRHKEGEIATGSDVEWYAWTPSGLYGVARERDFSGATVDELMKLNNSISINSTGREVVGQRGKQTVYLWQKIVTKKATVNALIVRLKKHVGRLKASFLPALRSVQARGYSGGQNISEQVAHNEAGARGSVNDQLDSSQPSLEIKSWAVGCGSPGMQGIATTAMNIRTQACIKRMIILQQHPERLMEEL
jgi:hypothetical protein